MNLSDELNSFTTEGRNINTMNIHKASTGEIVKLINDEDKKVAFAVEKELDNISLAVDLIFNCMNNGGRLIYAGAGTSGRLGVLDASECPPTYGVDYNNVIGLMAGGYEALLKAKEGAEDSFTLLKEDLININFNKNDVLVGIAASGRTPYCIGGFTYAKDLGAKCICITCNKNSKMSAYCDVSIELEVGAEVITGSTRMKSGTAQKMVLNILSTSVMVKLGKVYENLMVDVKATNEKLVQRAKRIVMEATNVDYKTSEDLLFKASNNVKLAIFLHLSNLEVSKAKMLLDEAGGNLSKAINLL